VALGHTEEITRNAGEETRDGTSERTVVCGPRTLPCSLVTDHCTQALYKKRRCTKYTATVSTHSRINFSDGQNPLCARRPCGFFSFGYFKTVTPVGFTVPNLGSICDLVAIGLNGNVFLV
jgi:hypothetical protein